MPGSSEHGDKGETIKEISAGGVCFRRVDGSIEIALIATRGCTVWGLPKGKVEEGENLARTAHREVEEETGLTGRIIKKIDAIHYWYSRKTAETVTHHFKIVYFFLMECTGGDITKHDHEVDEVRWYELEDALRIASYPGERSVIQKAREMLQSLGPAGGEPTGA